MPHPATPAGTTARTTQTAPLSCPQVILCAGQSCRCLVAGGQLQLDGCMPSHLTTVCPPHKPRASLGCQHPAAVATVLHPDFTYGRNFTNDVALLHLSRPVPFPTVKLETSSASSLAPGEKGGDIEKQADYRCGRRRHHRRSESVRFLPLDTRRSVPQTLQAWPDLPQGPMPRSWAGVS